MKTKEVLVAWQVLGQAKYDKLDSDQKVHVFHIGQQLKPIANGSNFATSSTNFSTERPDDNKPPIFDNVAEKIIGLSGATS